MTLKSTTINLIMRTVYLQIAWFFFVFYHHLNLILPLIAISIVFLDKIIFYNNISNKNIILKIILIMLIGISIDTTLVYFGVISLEHWKRPISPPFLWSIWIIFIPYYQYALDKLRKNLILALLFSGVGAPLSYLGASNISSFHVDKGMKIMLISLMWMIFFPLSLKLFTFGPKSILNRYE